LGNPEALLLVELAIGDAYGAGFEYVPRETIGEHNTAMQYVKHPRMSTRRAATPTTCR
jgi:hypothetical protein